MNTPISFARESWKQVDLGTGFINEFRLEISDFGRIRSFNQLHSGKILKGSMINGYRIIRIKLFKPRDEKTNETLKQMQDEITALSETIAAMKKKLEDKQFRGEERFSCKDQLLQAEDDLKKSKARCKSFYNTDRKKRTINYAGLIHRLVAEYFIPRTSEHQLFVSHIDHDKLNNKVNNLKWMTAEEKNAHQAKSPLVIEEKKKRKQAGYEAIKSKLTVTKVMYLKKLLNEGVPVRNLAKQFKVTETQIIRIKKNENWASVEAAK